MGKEETERKSTAVSRILDAFVPLNMFHIKHLAEPKGGNMNTIRIFSLSVIMIGLATFLALFITQSQMYTLETTVQTSDLSDSGYTCSMAAVISETVTLNDTADPVEYYDLVKINELGSQCFASLGALLPCTNIVYQPGSRSLNYGFFVDSLSAYSTGTLYFSASSGDADIITSFKYDVYSGSIEAGAGDYSIPDVINSVAMDSSGNGFFVVENPVELMLTNWNEFEAGTNNPLCGKSTAIHPVGCTQVLLTNDNFFQPYVLISERTANSTMLNNSFGTPFGTEVFSVFETTDIQVVLSFAVYTNQSSPPDRYLYYVVGNHTDNYNSSIYLRYREEVYQVAENFTKAFSIQVDSNHTYIYASYFVDSGSGTTGLARITLDQSNLRHSYVEYISNSSTWGAFGLVSDSFILTSYYDTSSMNFLTLLNLNTMNTSNVQYGYEGTAVGWTVCGNVSSFQLPPNVYESSCRSNGISWQLNYEDSYYFTDEMFESKAVSLAQAVCNATTLYPLICDNVANQPPYICTQKVYLPFFTVLSTAVANAHILMVVLFLLIGGLLTRVCEKRNDAERSTGQEVGDIQMRTNPMHESNDV
jgi:hypothetical protein